MPVQADRWWSRWLLLAVTGLVFLTHTVAMSTQGAPAGPSTGTTFVAVAADAPLCEGEHHRDGGHHSCLDAAGEHCATTLNGTGAPLVEPAAGAYCTSLPSSDGAAGPRSVDRAVTLAQLQVWRH